VIIKIDRQIDTDAQGFVRERKRGKEREREGERGREGDRERKKGWKLGVCERLSLSLHTHKSTHTKGLPATRLRISVTERWRGERRGQEGRGEDRRGEERRRGEGRGEEREGIEEGRGFVRVCLCVRVRVCVHVRVCSWVYSCDLKDEEDQGLYYDAVIYYHYYTK
jgi:hypothetical protein